MNHRICNIGKHVYLHHTQIGLTPIDEYYDRVRVRLGSYP
jgi:hypothetical protein